MKTPEEIAREAAERLVRVDRYYASNRYVVQVSEPNDDGTTSMPLDRDQARYMCDDTRGVLAQAIADAIRRYRDRCPLHGSPISDERLAEIRADLAARQQRVVRGPFRESGPSENLQGPLDLLAHIDYLHSIMADDIDTQAQQRAYRAGHEAGETQGIRQGAALQREAIVEALRDYLKNSTPLIGFGHVASITAAVIDTPLVTETDDASQT